MATYLSSKQEGFTGSYTDWVNAGRPSGASTSADQYGGSAKAKRLAEQEASMTNIISQFGIDKIPFKTNTAKQELALMIQGTQRALQQVGRESATRGTITQDTIRGDASGRLNWDAFKMSDGTFTGYERAPGGASNVGLPAGAMEADYNLLQQIHRQVRDSIIYPERKEELMGSVIRTVNKLDPNSGFGDVISHLDTKAAEAQDDKIQDASSMSYTAFEKTYGDDRATYDKLKSEGADIKANAPYGVNPNTGEPLSKTQAYSFARQANEGMSFSDFDASPAQFLETAGISMRDVDQREGEGTIQEQNQTGTDYLTWKGQQSAGTPSSYQDWLAADRGATTAQPEADAAQQAEAVAPTVAPDATQDALSTLEASSFFQGLPEDQKALLRMTVKSWDPTQEVNMDNVMSEFEKIKTNTIDPHFKEQVDVFSSDVRDQWSSMEATRGGELETERRLEGDNIRQAKSSLEQRGMTFSGEGIETLGEKAAIGRPGAEGSAIPSQQEVGQQNLTTKGGLTFEDGRFFEGTVGQSNRLMRTGSSRRYQDNLRRLGRQAEDALGATGANQLLPGFMPAGVTTGSIEGAKKQQLASTLSGLSGQQRQLNQYKQPTDFTSFNSQFQ